MNKRHLCNSSSFITFGGKSESQLTANDLASRSITPKDETLKLRQRLQSFRPIEALNYKTLIKKLNDLNNEVTNTRRLTTFQKACLHDTLSSIYNLVQSLSVQYSNNDIPYDICIKLNNLVENFSTLTINAANEHNDNMKFGIFQDKLTNLSPSLSSTSLNQEHDLAHHSLHSFLNYNPVGQRTPVKAPEIPSVQDNGSESEFDDEITEDLAIFENEDRGNTFFTRKSINSGHRPIKYDIRNYITTSMPTFLTPTKHTLSSSREFSSLDIGVKRTFIDKNESDFGSDFRGSTVRPKSVLSMQRRSSLASSANTNSYRHSHIPPNFNVKKFRNRNNVLLDNL